MAENDPNNANIQDNDISDQTNNWLVGQMVDLEAQVEAPAAWLNNLTYNWIVPGNTLFSYSAQSTQAFATPLQPDNVADNGDGQLDHTGTSDQQLQFFWVSTSGNSESDEIQLDVGNINGHSFSASTIFDVYEPTVTPGNPIPGGPPTIVPPSQLISSGTYNAIKIPMAVAMPTAFAGGCRWQLDFCPNNRFFERLH